MGRIDSEHELVRVRAGARILELGAPHLVGDGAASWETTGAVVEPSRGAGSPQPSPGAWRPLAFMVPALVVIIVFEIALVFAVAYLVTGRAY